jgi:ubiquinol-cytochrome c reductase iron-sulfur subunit
VTDLPEESRTPVSLTPASWNDPHMQPASAHPEHVERVIAALFAAGLVAFAAFGAAYWQNWAPWTLGATLGAGMVLVGAGLTAWGKYLMPRGPFVEDRHVLGSTPEEVEAFNNALVERGATPVRRRKLLGGLLAGGLGVFSIVALFPLVRSMGPLPGNTLQTTNWRRGSYLVDRAGRRLRASEYGVGSVVSSVFPEGFEDDEEAQATDVVILIRAAKQGLQTSGPRQTWAPAGFYAYSKMCTHAGCPVGLYEREAVLLICPCHQSMFDVADGAIPVFGPAPRPLPQLPLYIDARGFLRSQSGFGQPTGPGFWERA